MRAKGINYDTGFINKGVSSRQRFDIAVVDSVFVFSFIQDQFHTVEILTKTWTWPHTAS